MNRPEFSLAAPPKAFLGAFVPWWFILLHPQRRAKELQEGLSLAGDIPPFDELRHFTSLISRLDMATIAAPLYPR